jgi:D-lactate dehydrogenase (cytochrome)
LIEITAVKPETVVDGGDPVRVESEATVRSRFDSYLHDESSFGPGLAESAFFPTSEEEVAGFLKEMNVRKIPVTISGARTGIVGGAVPIGGALMSLEKMNGLVGINWNEQTRDWTVVAQPCIRLSELQDRIARKDFSSGANSTDPRWQALPRFLEDTNNYMYAPDPTETTASLGGTVATDASGAHTYFYGRTRTHVRSIRVVLATGDVFELRRGKNHIDQSRLVALRCLDGSTRSLRIPSYDRPKVKCVTGYFTQNSMDLIDLFIGSEGTLGVVTEVEIALTVTPVHVAMFLAFFPSQDRALGFVEYVRSLKFVKGSLELHSMEYMDSNSLSLLSRSMEAGQLPAGVKLPTNAKSTAILSEFAYEDAAEAIGLLQAPLEKFGSSLETAISGMGERDREFLKSLRHAIPESINKIVARRKSSIPGMHKISTDTAVPDEKLSVLMKRYSEKLEASNLEFYMFGHIAENHLHVNMIPRNSDELLEAERLAEELAREAVALGGTVSGEHGLGKMKRKLLRIQYNDEAIRQMLEAKKALDPNLILCQGNIFSESELRSHIE